MKILQYISRVHLVIRCDGIQFPVDNVKFNTFSGSCATTFAQLTGVQIGCSDRCAQCIESAKFMIELKIE